MDHQSAGWTDEQWQLASNYVDELDIIIKIPQDLPHGPVPKAFTISVNQPELPRDWAERQVADLAFVGPDGPRPAPGPFTLESRHRQISWGASGGLQEVTIWLANSGAEIALGMALNTLARKIAELRKSRLESAPQPPLDREQVEASARHRVWLARDRIDPSADTVHAESTTAHKNGSWTTRILAPDGVHYVVKTRQIADGIILSDIEDTTWRNSDDAPELS